jgi:hypothetical protein
MRPDRKRDNQYQAPEVQHLQAAVNAVKDALDPKLQKTPLSPAQEAQLESEESAEESGA